MVRFETTLFLRQDPLTLEVVTESVSDDLQQIFVGVREAQHKRFVNIFEINSSLLHDLLLGAGCRVIKFVHPVRRTLLVKVHGTSQEYACPIN